MRVARATVASSRRRGQLYAHSRISIGYRGGLPGVHSFFAGSHWRWHEAVKVGTRIAPEVTFKDLIELPSKLAGRMFKQMSLIRFLDDTGHELARADSWACASEPNAVGWAVVVLPRRPAA